MSNVRNWHVHLPLLAAASLWLGCSGTPRAGEASQVPDQHAPAAAPVAVKAPPPSAPSAAKAEEPANPSVAEALRYDPADPLANLEQADALDRGAGRAPRADVTPPARGCALSSQPRRVWTTRGVASIAALGDDFVIAGYARVSATNAAERVFIVRVTPAGLLEPVATLPVSPAHPTERVAPPGLAAQDAHATLAFSDGAGKLSLQQLQIGGQHGAVANIELATGVDTRFAPAIGFGKSGALVAYTLGSTPMRSMLARIGTRGQVLSTHDLTPAAMGAAAPAFVNGAQPNVVVMADPRDGMSPIARSILDVEGKPTAASEVAVPVGMMSQPPQLTAAQGSFGAFVAYAGLGSAATSAIGLVQITPKPGSPEALVKGTAYGALQVAAVRAGDAIVLAASSPLQAGKDPKHEITLTLRDERGLGAPLRVTSPSGDATHVALAYASSGTLGLVFTDKDGVYLATARCDER